MARPHLLFLDVETSGLDVGKDLLLEVAAGLYDVGDFFGRSGHEGAIGEVSGVIRPTSWDFMTTIDPVVADMHSINGLFGALTKPDAHASANTLEDQILALLDKSGECPTRWDVRLAGNSMALLDLPMLIKHMPRLMARVHFRIVDVSVLYAGLELVGFDVPRGAKAGTHRAIDDVRACVEQLRGIQRHLYAASDAQARSIRYGGKIKIEYPAKDAAVAT